MSGDRLIFKGFEECANDRNISIFRRCLKRNAIFLYKKTQRILEEPFQHPSFSRMSQAKRSFSGDPMIRTAISTSPLFEHVSGETLIVNKRRLKIRPPRSRFREDVSGEMLFLGIRPLLNREGAPRFPPPGPPQLINISLWATDVHRATLRV